MIGDLRYRVKLIRNVYKDDGSGGMIPKSTTTRELYMGVIKESGKEDLEHKAITATKTLECIIRFTKDILNSDIIEFDGVEYEIKAIGSNTAKSAYTYLTLESRERAGGQKWD